MIYIFNEKTDAGSEKTDAGVFLRSRFKVPLGHFMTEKLMQLMQLMQD